MMNITWIPFVGLVTLLIPIIQGWVATQWPEASYPITFVIVSALGTLARFLQLLIQKYSSENKQILPMPDGALGIGAPVEVNKGIGKQLVEWLI